MSRDLLCKYPVLQCILYSVRPGGLKKLWTLAAFLVLVSLLVGCSGIGQGINAVSTPAVPTVKLAKLRWCDKPLMVFRDEGGTPNASAGTPASNPSPSTISDWGQIRANLGFTIFLPGSLPDNSCLMSAYGTVRDPIFGGSFTISFLLPNRDSISLSEAPLRSQNAAFQCNISVNGTPLSSSSDGTPAATTAQIQTPVQICTGVREKTNIVFSARGTTNTLQTFFHDLQPDVDWVPA